MRFTELLNKLKIKIFAPATIVYRNYDVFESSFGYYAWLPACFVFSDEPIDKKTGYYKSVYVNNKRIKPYTIIPRHALIEVRKKPKIVTTLALAGIITAKTLTAVLIDLLIVGMVASVVTAATAKKGIGGKKGRKNYSSNDNPSISGSKNEALEKQVPILFGRTFQTFDYAQYAIPFVKNGYSGNRYKTYFIPSYHNVRYRNFKLGDVLIDNYRVAAVPIPVQAHGVSTFIGLDNAQTEDLNDKELSFDNTQAVYYQATVSYNLDATGSNLTLVQNYRFENATYNSWTTKTMNVTLTVVSRNEQVDIEQEIMIEKSDISIVSGNTYEATKTLTFDLSSYNVTEIVQTLTAPTEGTRGSNEKNLLCKLYTENLTLGSTSATKNVNASIDSYSGDRNEIISQSPTETRYGDVHFSFPQGLYKMNTSGGRVRTTIQAEITWKREGENDWRDISELGNNKVYTRDIDGNIEYETYNSKNQNYNIGSRVTRKDNIFTFKTPADLNYADTNFFECVGFDFTEHGTYLINIKPIIFKKDNYWIGTINVSDIVWRMDTIADGFNHLKVVDYDMLPHVTQVAATFNATTQLDGDVDELGAIGYARIKNVETGILLTNEDDVRNPVDIIYYLLTDTHSNPMPMTDAQIDFPSFIKARRWCDTERIRYWADGTTENFGKCKCDGIINEEVKYETVLSEIASNNQLYIIPNKWGKISVKVDTNEDNRPIKALFNADNSWDLSISRVRGKLNRTMAIRCSFINEETWGEDEITGYWYNGKCNWQPEQGKDDTYYQTEKKDLKYIRNIDNVKRRIAYELEIMNEKNVTAEFKIAREVLDLDILDRVLVADYTRINDGISGTIEEVLKDDDNNIIGVRTSQPFEVKVGMTMTIRSVDTSNERDNVKVYNIKPNEISTSKIYFEEPIPAEESNLRSSGFYNVDGQEFYYSGDLYMAGTSEILSMVVKEIEEISGDDFTSKVTCRLY